MIDPSRDNELSIDRAPGLNLLRTGNRSRAENADGAVLKWTAKAAGGQSSFSGAMACSSPLWGSVSGIGDSFRHGASRRRSCRSDRDDEPRWGSRRHGNLQDGSMAVAPDLHRQLEELIEALDRRTPHIERSGEALIARDAAALRRRAIERLAELDAETWPPSASTP